MTGIDDRLGPRGEVALHVAADAALEGVDLDTVQVQALIDGAAHAGTPRARLEAVVAGGAACRGGATEDWYPPDDGSEVTARERAAERGHAGGLCRSCPVRTECLALSWQIGTLGSHGVWGGLPARDRRVVLPLWVRLSHRLRDDRVVEDLDAGRDERGAA
ncbi:MAG: WhiB family transcriptional regulator [Pseudonocardiaceae bacterium]